MEKQLTTLNSKYIGGNKLTIADCAMAAAMADTWEIPASPFNDKFKPVIAKYPKIQAYFLNLREAFKERKEVP